MYNLSLKINKVNLKYQFEKRIARFYLVILFMFHHKSVDPKFGEGGHHLLQMRLQNYYLTYEAEPADV